MSKADIWIERYRRRLAWGQFLQRAAETTAIYLLMAGAVVLMMKLGGPRYWQYSPWLLIGVLPMLGIAAWRSEQDIVPYRESIALLDRQIQADGLLMTLSEMSDEEWNEKLPQGDWFWKSHIPKFRLGRLLKPCRIPALFVIGACFLPLRPEAETKILAGTVGDEATQDLDEMLEAVQEIAPLEEEEEQEIQQAIDELREETEHQPLTHEKWETIDSLSDRLRMKIESQAASVSKAQSALQTLGGSEGGVTLAKLDAKQMQDHENAALETLQKAGASNTIAGKTGNLSAATQKQLQRLLKDGKLSSDPSERQAQLDALDEFLKSENEKLCKAREKCKSCKGGKCSSCQGALCNGNGNCNKPGRGGITRGRGDAEMAYGDESDEQGSKFKEIALPPGYLDEQSDQISKITLAAPNETPVESTARGSFRTFFAESGQEVWKRPLSPRHRQVVKGYFSKQ
ncbi:MAG: hypothetical protein O2955_03390 [Planctomycetota bacterium]|nr:hypothetical protein [Planctomycetota bacterium]MDA1211532.1 hypothetical protein [Planctomycetota bacterium]